MALLNPLSAEELNAPETVTVRHLVDAIGPQVLRVLVAPRGLEIPVRSTVLHDPVDPLRDEPDAMLLASGIRSDSEEAASLLTTACDIGYRVVAIKSRGCDVSALLEQASRLGIAVLAAADEVPWRHLDSLLLSVLGSHGLTASSHSGAGDELFALSNAIAAVIGGSVAMEDIDRRVIAYSSLPDQRIDEIRERGILNRRVPDMERNLAQYRSVLAASGVVQFPEVIDEFARWAIAIRAGNQPLGTIWAIIGLEGPGADAERVLVDGAKLAALHMLRSRNAGELELHVRESALRGALDGSLTANEVSFRLALPGGSQLVLAGFAAVPLADGSTPLITHVSSELGRYIAAFRPDAAIATTARAVYALLPSGGNDAALRLATGALPAMRTSFGDRIKSAVSFTSANPSELPAMRREVDDILRVTTRQEGLPAVAALKDVHTRVLLTRLEDELSREPRLRHPGVDAIVSFDQENRTDYAASVVAWLDAVGDMGNAASQLGVHPNTLRYRLRRVGELFDVSLEDADDRLSIWLQLRLAATPRTLDESTGQRRGPGYAGTPQHPSED